MRLMALLPHTQKKLKSLEQCTVELTTTRSKICGLSTSAIFESTKARGKNRSNHVGDRHGVDGSQSGKEGVARIHLHTAKFSLFR